MFSRSASRTTRSRLRRNGGSCGGSNTKRARTRARSRQIRWRSPNWLSTSQCGATGPSRPPGRGRGWTPRSGRPHSSGKFTRAGDQTSGSFRRRPVTRGPIRGDVLALGVAYDALAVAPNCGSCGGAHQTGQTRARSRQSDGGRRTGSRLPVRRDRTEVDHPGVASGGLNLGTLHGGHQGRPFGVRGRRSLLWRHLEGPLPDNWAPEGHPLGSDVTKIRP